MNSKNSINSKVGAVFVVGGGIGGIQASLDLADSGFKVYLLEKSPSIGGVMAQLDKTFPTNDCSMCILAPKLVSVARHPNIKIITNAEIESLSGEAGNFIVTVKKEPRYIDEAKCTGCGDCAKVCPIYLPNEFDELLSERNAIYRPYPQAVPNAFKIDKTGIPPCKDACPAGLSGQAYSSFIAHNKFKEAIEYIRGILPFPSICGRVCHHPCEENCNRKDIDEPVSIMRLKRFVADWARNNSDEPVKKAEITHQEKIAIIGAGPSGLTCAYKLLKMGYPVTVLDSSTIPGGMMTSCIPEYRLPNEIALYDIKRLLDFGVEFKGGVTFGKDKDLKDLKNDGYKAIFIAIGAQNAKKLKIEGIENKGVHYGIPFLKAAKSSRNIKNFGKQVIVIGGGNVAIDCARTALRLGAEEIHMVCLETRDLTSKDRMPAHEWEIIEAEEEGVIIHHSLGPKSIVAKEGKIYGLETIECISVYDKDGKFNPQFKKESKPITINGDTVIIAIGQEPNPSGFEKLEWTPWKTLKVDPLTLETNVPGIFAGGDIVRGPASIIEAVADGNEAAISIDRFLSGDNLRTGREKPEIKIAKAPEKEFKKILRQKPKILVPEARKNSWSEIEFGFTLEQAVEEAKRCMECGICASCYLCVDACKAEAIDHIMTEETLNLNVGSIILAPGFDEFDAKKKSEYGYGRYKNVVTSIEFERILSASGPFGGHIQRLSDGKPPKRIAFIQCVGSRDTQSGKSYCSSVCCTYAIKEAIIAKEHSSQNPVEKNGLETTIFFMDIRTFGKGFESYYERAKNEYGVKFIRAGVSRIDEDSNTKNLMVHYESEAGEIRNEEFSLVVLSVGLLPKAGMAQLAKRLRVTLNEYGFCRTSEFMPVDTIQDGIYVCGTSAGPKDIPETVTQASAAAVKAMCLLTEARNTLITKKEYPPELDVLGQEPRIGAFICHCGINIGGYVDVPSVVEYAKTLPNVVYAEDNLYTCSQDTQKRIVELIKEHKLNRVIVASCTPRTHEPLFRDTIREAGLNPYLFEMANIRDQCSWIHMKEPKEATEKAKDLVRMAVAKARLIAPLKQVEIDVTQKALVIGGGIAGMISSISLAEQGFEVFMVEKENELGGNLRHTYYTIEGRDVQNFLIRTIEKVKTNRLIKVFNEAKIESISGYIGNYETEVILKDGTMEKFKHGVVIVATGAQEYQPTEYLYGQDKRVITQKELEGLLEEAKNQKQEIRNKTQDKNLSSVICNLSSVVMIQCVGSRDDSHQYCSRICCSQAVKNSLRLLEINPDASIYVLYRDVRTYGLKEDFYRKAREAGVVFIRYDDESKPELRRANGKLMISVFEPILNEKLEIVPDLVVLSNGVEPEKENEKLAKLLKVPLNSEGFFLEAHVKLRPVDFATEGIFVAGMAHSPKCIDETINQAEAAAARASTIIANKKYSAEAAISQVNEELCAGCGVCSGLCPYEAIEMVVKEGKRSSKVNEALCKGCGSCASACPSGAMQQQGFRSEQLSAMVIASVSEAI
ncbi:MAG: FAD-dependent oxidoreductase [bacterium]|nr:FAD-dependent oxidoreductase [bacterium]